MKVDPLKLGLYLAVLYQDRRGELEASAPEHAAFPGAGPPEEPDGGAGRAKQDQRAAWHLPADSVLFVPATPNAELAERQAGGGGGAEARDGHQGGPSLKLNAVWGLFCCT